MNAFQGNNLISLTNNIRNFMLELIRTKWLLFLLVGVGFGLMGITYAWLKKPMYTAEITFTTETESSSKLGAYAALAAQFGFDLGMGSNSLFEGDNLIELLKSRKLIERTLLSKSNITNDLLIIEYFKLYNFDDDVLQLFSKVDVTSLSREQDSIINGIYKFFFNDQLDVFRKDKKLNIITVKMKSPSEKFSKQFVEMLTSNTTRFYIEYKSRKARQNVDILQKQVDSVQRMLFGSINTVAEITDLNVNPMKQILKASSQKKQVDVQVNGILYGELIKNLELAKLNLQRETPLIQIIDIPHLPLKKEKPGRLLMGIIFASVGVSLLFFYILFRQWSRIVKTQ